MLLSSTVNDGLFQTLDGICGTTKNTYPLKRKCADINDALDWYLQIAFKSDGEWNFDDLNETSPPIDTQDIVSGTNRYKFGSFTEKILRLLKLEVLDSNGNGLSLIPETLDSFGKVLGSESGRMYGFSGGSFQEVYVDAPSGTPTHYIKYGDFVYLRPKPDYNYTAGLLAYFQRPLTKFEFVSCVAEADDDTFTASGHGLSAGDTVIFEVDNSGTIPGGVTADLQYYVISSGLTSSVFKVSTTLGGSTIDVTSDGSNVHFLKTSGGPGVPEMHHKALARRASAEYMGFNNTNGVYNSRLSLVLPEIVRDERRIEEFYSDRSEDVPNRMTVFQEDNR